MCLSMISKVLRYGECSGTVPTVVEVRYQRDVIEGHTQLGIVGYVFQRTFPR